MSSSYSEKSPIVVVAGTNRKNALSTAVSHHYAELLQAQGAPAKVVTLTDLPSDFISSALYENSGKHAEFNELRGIMERAEKYVFVIPEYNGSFPGVFKAFLDGLVLPKTLKGKKCALVGVSKGIQGGLLALSHLTDILNYLRAYVYPLKPALAQVHDGRLETVLGNGRYVALIEEQVKGFVGF